MTATSAFRPGRGGPAVRRKAGSAGARPRRWVRSACLALVGIVAAAGGAQAGLFDDDEARKAIIDLRGRVAAIEEAGRARSADLATANTQLAEQLAATRRSLVDLNNQLDAIRADIARLRGSEEQLARDVAELQRRQSDVGQSIDDRLRRLEPVKVTIEGREAAVDPDEKKAYEEAIAAIRAGEFDRSVTMLTAFQRRWPSSAYADAVRFWLGNALYGKRDYKGAIGVFRGFVNTSPAHPRAPEALLAIANSQAEMKDPKAARRTIEELIKAYPQSEAAVAGKDRLASLR